MTLNIVIVAISIVWVGQTNSLLLEPPQRCPPTATARGTCHDCVCSAAGEFHCRERSCHNETDAFNEDTKRECEPNHVYRDNTLFCTCDNDGYWISLNCRRKFHRIPPRAYHPAQKIRTNIPCTPNSLILLDCNICECPISGFIELSSCTNRQCNRGRKADVCTFGDILRTEDEVCSCSDINLYIDRLCFAVSSELIQEVDRNLVESIIDVGRNWMRTTNFYTDNACTPNTVLKIDCNRCVCTENGVLACTDKYCYTPAKFALRSKEPNAFDSLPILQSRESPCRPNVQYRYKCNTCLCSLKGVPSCTTMICLDDLVVDKDVLEAALQENGEKF